MNKIIKKLVSKNKKRFQQDEFDLDLTYITPRIIAMGFPSSNMEGVYRNSMADVKNFFAKYHADHFKIYNLCSERKYEPKEFNNSCKTYPFDDHNPCAFEMLIKVCEDIHEYLSKHDKNVAAVHCKAGKGRTGLVISAYLLFSGHSKTAAEALNFYGEARTSNKKGVTIPSQQRYVMYMQMYLRLYTSMQKPLPKPPTLTIRSIALQPRADFDVNGGCDPYFVILDINKKKLYSYKKIKKVREWRKESEIVLQCGFEICGDVKIMFYDEDTFGEDDKMFHFWINTTFIRKKELVLTKSELDGAVKDKKCRHFPKNFICKLTFDGVEEDENDSASASLNYQSDSSSDSSDDDDDYRYNECKDVKSPPTTATAAPATASTTAESTTTASTTTVSSTASTTASTASTTAESTTASTASTTASTAKVDSKSPLPATTRTVISSDAPPPPPTDDGAPPPPPPDDSAPPPPPEDDPAPPPPPEDEHVDQQQHSHHHSHKHHKHTRTNDENTVQDEESRSPQLKRHSEMLSNVQGKGTVQPIQTESGVSIGSVSPTSSPHSPNAPNLPKSNSSSGTEQKSSGTEQKGNGTDQKTTSSQQSPSASGSNSTQQKSSSSPSSSPPSSPPSSPTQPILVSSTSQTRSNTRLKGDIGSGYYYQPVSLQPKKNRNID